MNPQNFNKKKKVLLFKVPDCDFPSKEKSAKDLKSSFNYTVPVISSALAFLGAFLRKFAADDYDIKLIDVAIQTLLKSKTDEIDPSSLIECIETEIKNTDYDAIGLSTAYVSNQQWTQLVADLSRKYHLEKPIILGGGYPSILPRESLRQTRADYAVIGEGEDTFLFLLNKIFDIRNEYFEKLFPQISGYANWEGEDIHIIPKTTFIQDLDNLPFPAWDLLDGKTYFKKMIDHPLKIVTSRGCCYKCTFCSAYESWGNKVRFRSAGNVLSEIDYMYKGFDFKKIWFVDDNMTLNKKRIDAILRGLIKKNYNISWRAAYFALQTLKKDTVELMAKAGMSGVGLPVESGSPRIQKEIRKNLNLKKVEEVFNWFREYDFCIDTNFMIGFPSETIEDIQMSLEFAKKLKAHKTAFWIVTPWPGTKLYDDAIKNNQLSKNYDINNLRYRGKGYFTNVPWNYNEIKQLIYDTNISINFLNNLDLNSPKHYDRLYEYWHRLEKSLPEHAILFMCLGYLSKKMKRLKDMERYYRITQHLYEKEDVTETYGKYLYWKNKPVLDYMEFINQQS